MQTRLLTSHARAALLIVALLALAPSRAHAAGSVQLPVPPVAQRFSVAGSVDDGSADCLPATEAMVLQTLVDEHFLRRAAMTYPAVRGAFRRQVPDVNRLINMTVATRVTQSLTGDALTAAPVQTFPSAWQSFVRSRLARGFPVIAAIPDWHRLAAGWPDTSGPVWHAVVITGMTDTTVTYRDPWGADPLGSDGGRAYTMTLHDFAAAWNGDNGWWALTFWRVPGSVRAMVQLRSGVQATPHLPGTTPTPAGGVLDGSSSFAR